MAATGLCSGFVLMGWIIVVVSSEHRERQNDKLSRLFVPNTVPEISWNFLAQRGGMDRTNLDYSFDASELARPVGVEIRFTSLSWRDFIEHPRIFADDYSADASHGDRLLRSTCRKHKKFSLIVGCSRTPDFINLQNFQLAFRLAVLITGESDNFYSSLFCPRFCFARKFRVNQTECFSNDDINVAMVIREIELLLLGVHGRMKSGFCCEYQAATKRNLA